MFLQNPLFKSLLNKLYTWSQSYSVMTYIKSKRTYKVFRKTTRMIVFHINILFKNMLQKPLNLRVAALFVAGKKL